MLGDSYPNPFNPITTIQYGIPENDFISLSVYDINGKLVNALINSTLTSGTYSVVWDGNDMYGTSVSAGLYIYTLHAEGISLNRKMMLMK